MSKRNILFIVEGECDEPKFIYKIKDVFGIKENITIFSYKTSVHELISKLFRGSELDEDLELLSLLKSNESNEEERNKLSRDYTDVFLIFDFDPQSHKKNYNQLKKMIKFFNDSTGYGKLFINFPMMQSLRHLNEMPDNDFKDRMVTVSQCHNYKEILDSYHKYQDITKYDYFTIISIILHHLKKANYIVNAKYDLPNLEDYLLFDYTRLLDKQIELLGRENCIYVCNTFVLSIIDYSPHNFYLRIKEQLDRFLI